MSEPGSASRRRRRSRSRAEWEERTLRPRLRRTGERDVEFSTVSSLPIERLYTRGGPAGRTGTRRTSSGYPGRVSRTPAASTPRCTAAGCGPCASSPASAPPADTNQRFKYLLEHGQTGLSTAFDLPTLMGRDSDDEMSRGEVGREGVAIDTPGGHGDAVRRHPAGPGLHLDDDQRPGGRDLRHVPRGGREAGRCRSSSSAGRCRTTSSRSTSPRRSGSTRRGRACASSPT